MATKRPTTASDGDGFPAAPDFSRDDRGRIYAESVISSRLSDDGGEAGEQRPKSTTSKKSGASRPETSKSKRSNKSRSARKSSKDASAATGAPASHRLSGTGEPATRTRNLASRSSHVPSLTSNAFFRPMSSQKLQAHRGASRPTTTQQQQQQNRLSLGQQQHSALDDGATDIGGSVLRHNEPTAAALEDYSMGVPPSRGTEGTEQDRVTSNTSPTGGHYPTGSLSDSVRPLHKSPEVNRNNLSVNVGKTYQDIGRTIPSPVKSPRSFRSSFLLPGRESGQGQNRNTEGAEKLSSGASSPKLAPRDQSTQHRPAPQPNDAKPGHVYQYFEGNTRFWLGGRWQNTKGKPINIATGVFILLLCVLFLAFSAPWLWHNVSPALPITFAYFSFVCMSSFVHASVSDPGVSFLLRSSHVTSSLTRDRFSLEVFISFRPLTNTMTRYAWDLRLVIGLRSNRPIHALQLWRFQSSTVEPATFGDLPARTIVDCAITALRDMIIIVCGSTTVSENATTATSSPCSHPEPYSASTGSSAVWFRSLVTRIAMVLVSVKPSTTSQFPLRFSSSASSPCVIQQRSWDTTSSSWLAAKRRGSI